MSVHLERVKTGPPISCIQMCIACFDMEVIKSRRGNPCIAKDGHIWCKDKINKNGTIAFRCVVKTCSSRGVAGKALEYFEESSQEHNHPADQSKIEVMKRRNTLKSAVLEQPTVPIKRLYNEVFADVEDGDSMVNVPPLKSIRTSLYMERSKRIPKLPVSAAEIQLIDEWRETRSGADFILCDSGTNEDRIIAFGTVANLRLLTDSETYYGVYGWNLPHKSIAILSVIHHPYCENGHNDTCCLRTTTEQDGSHLRSTV